MPKIFTPTITLHSYTINERVISDKLHDILIPAALEVQDTRDVVYIYFAGESNEKISVFKNTETAGKNAEINWSSSSDKPAIYASLMAIALTFAVSLAQAFDDLKAQA